MCDKWYDKIANKYGFEVNPDMKDTILEGLERNKAQHGARYCPCRLQKTVDTVCPCREFREEGHCHCGLFI